MGMDATFPLCLFFGRRRKPVCWQALAKLSRRPSPNLPTAARENPGAYPPGAARPCRAGRNSAVFPIFERYACFL